MSTRGTMMIKARRTNTYATRPLILRALPGATTTLRRAWGMIKRDGRRPGHSTSGPLSYPLVSEFRPLQADTPYAVSARLLLTTGLSSIMVEGEGQEGISAPRLLSSAQCARGGNCGAEASAANRHEGAGEKDLQQRAGATRAGRYDKSALRGGA